ncbi:MAG: S-methyl-5-thioribose-1-phosphate isomerase [Polyangiales bacterium]
MILPHPSPVSGASYSAVELDPLGHKVIMLDQRRLPLEEHYLEWNSAAEVARSIREMVVRGAPAIGIAAAYGLAVEAHRAQSEDADHFDETMERAAATLIASRPTAVNLKWAVDRVSALAKQIGSVALRGSGDGDARAAAIAEFARQLHQEEVKACEALGARGAVHIPDGATVLTHCNAGALATGGFGSALGVIRAANNAGKRIRVLACETRPYLQGARLTAWELMRDAIAVEVITDSMVGHFFGRGDITAVVVGADRIAANGDFANKIGTYGIACLSRLHQRPFLVAAPQSTLDVSTPDGAAIVIEERSSDEVLQIGGVRIAPRDVTARHPAFDVTPARLVTRLITETFDVAGESAAAQIANASKTHSLQ